MSRHRLIRPDAPTGRDHRASRRTRGVLAVALLATGALVAAACGGGSGDDAETTTTTKESPANADNCPLDALESASGVTEVTVWHPYNTLTQEALETAAADYNASQSLVKVSVEAQGTYPELLKKYEDSLGNPENLPDVIFSEDTTLFDWMKQWSRPGDDDQVIRGILGRLLFSGDDVKKSVKVLSGGEKGRMLYGKLILQQPNVLVMDEPTNHMDMESIESLNLALELFKGTLVFVSHDRQFVSSLATQVLELNGDGTYEYYVGGYEDYLESRGLE